MLKNLPLLFYASFAVACLGPFAQTTTYFARLLARALTQPVVAKIKVISSAPREPHAIVTTVEVVAATKGVKVGDRLRVLSEPLSSCNADPVLNPHAEFFVAGQVGGDGLFRGEWTGRDLATDAAAPASSNKCKALGEQLTTAAGSAPGAMKFKSPCCEGLSAVSEPQDALNGAAPGRVICAACGDRICDRKHENKFNCTQDCAESD